MPRILTWVLIAVTALTVAGWFDPSDSAMANCQLTHSYDVCFQQLNR